MHATRPLLAVLNVPRHLANAAIGRNHTSAHRITIGLCIVFIGAGVAKLEVFTHGEVVRYLLDTVGYGIHGIGLTPVVEWLLEETDKA